MTSAKGLLQQAQLERLGAMEIEGVEA